MSTSTKTAITELVKDFNTVMLITRAADDELHARPMQLAEVSADAALTFATSIESDLITELENDHRAAVTMQNDTAYVSLSGMIRLNEDTSRISELWSPGWHLWFPRGAEDPALRLLEFRPNAGGYWELSGKNGFSFLVDAGMAILQGDDIRSDKITEHDTTRM